MPVHHRGQITTNRYDCTYATPRTASAAPKWLGYAFGGRDWATLFDKLRRHYGVWRLAWLEAILRLADWDEAGPTPLNGGTIVHSTDGITWTAHALKV